MPCLSPALKAALVAADEMAELRKQWEIERAWGQHRERYWHQISAALRARLSERQNHRCCWCGVRTTDEGPTRATIEHIVPRSKGGSDHETRGGRA